jgi:phospholipase/carboxylesterase
MLTSQPGNRVINAEQEVSSRALIKQFVAQVKQKYILDEIYLGGFSQGAIMSYSVGLNNPEEINGIIALSGRMLEQTQQSVTRSEALAQLRIFIAHGTHDGTLPVHYARQAQAFLQTLHVPLTYHEYNIGHQVNGEVIQDLISWLP